MKTMTAAKFRATCLAVMDEVATTREAVEITKRGKPVARIAPLEPQDIEEFLRQHRPKGEGSGVTT